MKTESNKKHAPKRSRQQTAKDHADISGLWLDGLRQREIVEWIAKNRPYTLSLGMVNADIQKIINQWLADSKRNIDEMKARDVARLFDIERRATEAYERSLRDLVITKRDGEKLITITQKRDGDPRWLSIILDCIRERSKILGYAKPERFQLGGQDEAPREPGPDIRMALEIAYGDQVQSVHWAVAVEAPRLSP